MTDGSSKQYSMLKSSAEKLRHELDRWMDVAWVQGEKALDAVGLRDATRSWVPSIDVVETPDQIRIRVDLPDVHPDQIDLTLVGNMLTVSGERAVCDPGEHETVHLRECATGVFSRSVPLPVSVDPEKVAAESSNGVLHITVGKSKTETPTKIKVGPEKPSGEQHG